MSVKRITIIFSMVFLLAGCQKNLEPTIPIESPTSEQSPPPTDQPGKIDETGDPGRPVTKVPETKESNSVEEPGPTEGSSSIDTAWDDRELYQDGLITGEEQILNDLPGATVYHILLDIVELTRIDGQLEAHFTNQENEPLQEIYFHLFPDQLGGSIEIENVLVNGQVVQTTRDKTALKITLDEPLNPGEQTAIEMDFITIVPTEDSPKYNILAFDDQILTLAHFYPMIAVYDEQGWHIESTPPHGDETFADSSFYQVQVHAPKDQVIAASGSEVAREEDGDSQRVTFAAGPVRDFYMAMSDRFERQSDTIGQTTINSYAPPEYAAGAGLALEVAREAVDSYNGRFGTYPFTELDIVSTPTFALGVEYPGVFVNAIRLYDLSESSSGLPNSILLESTTAHETAHQWFYSLVGNDQLNEPWLDEAVTQYATWKYYVDRYGEQNAQGYYNSLLGRWNESILPRFP